MFTGLIESVGEIAEVKAIDAGFNLRIASDIAGDLRLGESVAVNGVCLTVVDVAKRCGSVFDRDRPGDRTRDEPRAPAGRRGCESRAGDARQRPVRRSHGARACRRHRHDPVHPPRSGLFVAHCRLSGRTRAVSDSPGIHRGRRHQPDDCGARKDVVRRPDCPVYLVAHESARQAGRRSREPRVRYGRQVRGPRHGVHGDERYDGTTQDRQKDAGSPARSRASKTPSRRFAPAR